MIPWGRTHLPQSKQAISLVHVKISVALLLVQLIR